MTPQTLRKIQINGGLYLHEGDLPRHYYDLAKNAGVVSWDIETSGLEWRKERIALCQICVFEGQSHSVHIVRINGAVPVNTRELLQDAKVCKIFHHAAFDLRFMAHRWAAHPCNVVCTKIASKVLHPGKGDHSLKSLLENHLGIVISKQQRLSNWFADDLTSEQIKYAINDVIHLRNLFNSLQGKLIDLERWNLAKKSFDYLPTRVCLDVLGCDDVFAY